MDLAVSPSAGEIWIYFKFAYHGVLTSTKDDIFDAYGPGSYPADKHARVFLTATGTLGLEFEGSMSTGTVSAMSPDKVYHVWAHFKKGAGTTNESGSVAFVQDTGAGSAIEPTSGHNFATIANGTGTDSYINLEWFHTLLQDTSVIIIYDKVRVSTIGDIGNNPQ